MSILTTKCLQTTAASAIATKAGRNAAGSSRNNCTDCQLDYKDLIYAEQFLTRSNESFVVVRHSVESSSFWEWLNVGLATKVFVADLAEVIS